MHLKTLNVLLGLTLAYDRMDRHQILVGTRKLRQDEHKIKTHNATSDKNSSIQSSPTFRIADQLKKVSLQKKRKCNSPDTHYGSSIKIVRNEQTDVNFQREKTGKRSGYTESQHFNAENKTQKCSSVTRLLKKDKDGDTYVLYYRQRNRLKMQTKPWLHATTLAAL